MGFRKLMAILIIVLCASIAWAQNVSSSVKGVVVDTSQAGIPGANCTLTDQATSRVLTAPSWADGAFTFPNVPTGTYSLKIEAGGFRTLTVRDIVVTANEIRTLGNLAMQVGEVREVVNVTAEATVVSVQLASGERSGLVSGDQLNNIALKGRDFWAMLATLPGVVDDYSQGRETINNKSNNGTYINGGSALSKNYSVDGIYSLNTSNGTTVVQPNMDSIAEVKVLTTNYQAEHGRMSSGVISVITKSGSQSFHGSGWSAFRHEELNANSFFNNRTNTPKSPYRYHIYGYSIGGPIYIPKHFNSDKSKLFFFFSQEYDPITANYGSKFVTTPTEAERKGDFTHSYDVNGALILIKDPQTPGQYFPGNTIPSNRINQAGQSILNFFPLPNYTDPNPKNLYQWNYRSTWSAPSPLRNDVLRVDYNPLPSLNIYYRLLQNKQVTHPAWGDWKINNNYTLTSLNNAAPGLSHVVQATKVFSPTLVNEAKFAYTLNNINSDFADPSKVMRSAMGNLPQLFSDAGSPDIAPDISFGGQPANTIQVSIGPGNWYWRGTEYTYTDNLSKVWSKHSLKAGFNWDYYRAEALDTRAQWRGAFNFARDTNNPFDTNNSFANALVGNFDNYTELTARAFKNTVLNVFETYVQDNWRIHKRLTLDIGLRTVSQPPEFDRNANGTAHFDPAFYAPGKSAAIYYPAFDAAGKRVAMDPVTKAIAPAAYIGLFVPNSGNPANGSVICGSNDYPRGCFTRKKIFFAPRIGFAWDVFGNGRTALRGGFGIFYDTADANSFETSVGNPPTSYMPVQYYGNLNSIASSTGLLGPSAMSSQVGINQQPLPMTMNYSLGIQHQMARNIVVEASYVGSQVRHSLLTREINFIPMYSRFDPRNADPTSPGKALSDNFFRPYYGNGTITPYEMTGTSSYNGLQTSLNRRFSKGLQVGVSYTFSKVMGTNGVSPYFPVRQRTWGRLGQDRTNVFVANYMYDLPKVGGRLGFRPAGWVLDNWQLSGITSFVSGAPFTPGFSTTDGQDITGSAEGARITIVGDPYLPKSQRTFYQNFNTAAFARTPLRGFGNAGVNILRGPGVNNWDLAVAKRFPFGGERRYFQFRTEFFNAWNHTQFSGLDTGARFDQSGNQVNPTFGSFTAARAPRIIQFSARVMF